MLILLALIIGILFGSGIYMLLRRTLVKMILGIILISHAANLILFVVGGTIMGAPPFAGPGGEVDPATVADPLPQALILTALVISLGVIAFFMVLLYRFYTETGKTDLDELAKTTRS